MIRNLKVMGLAVFAVMAATAISASAASAAQFKSEVSPVFIEGNQETQHVFTVTTGTVKCTTAKFTGTNTAPASSIELHPVYTGCTAFGQKATVDTTGCNYKFTAPGSGGPVYAIGTEVICTGGKVITVSTTGLACTVTVGSQSVAGVTAENKGSGASRNVLATIETGKTLTYTETGAECAAPGTRSTGKYTGTATLKGFTSEGGTQKGVWIE